MPTFPLPLTERQRHALRTIIVHIERHGVAPSVVELSEAMGLANRMASYAYLNSLEFKGYLSRQIGVARSIVVLRREDGVSVKESDDIKV